MIVVRDSFVRDIFVRDWDGPPLDPKLRNQYGSPQPFCIFSVGPSTPMRISQRSVPFFTYCQSLTQLRESTLRTAAATVDAREHFPGIADPDPPGFLRVVANSNSAGHVQTVQQVLCGYPVDILSACGH
jgi:hypothetical protein